MKELFLITALSLPMAMSMHHPLEKERPGVALIRMLMSFDEAKDPNKGRAVIVGDRTEIVKDLRASRVMAWQVSWTAHVQPYKIRAWAGQLPIREASMRVVLYLFDEPITVYKPNIWNVSRRFQEAIHSLEPRGFLIFDPIKSEQFLTLAYQAGFRRFDVKPFKFVMPGWIVMRRHEDKSYTRILELIDRGA